MQKFKHVLHSNVKLESTPSGKSWYVPKKEQPSINYLEIKDDVEQFISKPILGLLNYDSPLIFLKISCLDRYRGLENETNPLWYGGYPKHNKYGHEVLNFKESEGNCFGYTPFKRNLVLESHFNVKRNSLFAPNILVVWVSPNPFREKGHVVTGWYKNAVLLKSLAEYKVEGRNLSNPNQEPEFCDFVTVAKKENCFLIPRAERNIEIPTNTDGGWSNLRNSIWYAESLSSRNFRGRVVDYINDYRFEEFDLETNQPKPNRKNSRNQNLELRLQVEIAALEMTMQYLKDLGYDDRKDFSGDHLGWDITAKKGQEEIHVEVKGLSQSEGQLTVELTPNEYEKLEAQKESGKYWISVVHNCLEEPPILHIFKYQNGQWESYKNGYLLTLNVQVVPSARLSFNTNEGRYIPPIVKMHTKLRSNNFRPSAPENHE